MVNKAKIGILQNIKHNFSDFGAEFSGKSFSQKLTLLPPLLLIRTYKVFFSPVLSVFGVRCRHYPSCSSYASRAFLLHGVWRGGWLSLSRLSRCHPWGSSGVDLVPRDLEPVGWRFWRNGDWAWTERSSTGEETSHPPLSHPDH